MNNAEIKISCKYSFPITMRQAANQESVVCPNCRKKIQLKDEGGSVPRGLVLLR